MACTDNSSVTRQNWRRLWPSALHAHGSMKRHEMQMFPPWALLYRKTQPEPCEMIRQLPLTFKTKQKQLWKARTWSVKQVTLTSFIQGAKTLKQKTAVRHPQSDWQAWLWLAKLCTGWKSMATSLQWVPESAKASGQTCLTRALKQAHQNAPDIWGWLTTRQNKKPGPGKLLLSVNKQQTNKQTIAGRKKWSK